MEIDCSKDIYSGEKSLRLQQFLLTWPIRTPESWIAFHIWKKILVNQFLIVTETMSKGAKGLWVHLLWDRIWVHGFHESIFKQDDWNQIGWKFTKSVSICDAVFPLWQMGAHISSGRKSSEIVASVFLMATHFVPRRPDSFNMKLLLRCFISGVTFVFSKQHLVSTLYGFPE